MLFYNGKGYNDAGRSYKNLRSLKSKNSFYLVVFATLVMSAKKLCKRLIN